MTGRWRIHELMDLAAEALAEVPFKAQPSGRVRDIPDVRTIRYYTTIGLIDRPLEMRGRTAYYGPRHLRQLVAIKRLQVEGLSLVEIQESLVGASAKQLDRLAALPPGFLDAALSPESYKSRDPAKKRVEVGGTNDATRRTPFWSAKPVVPRLNRSQESDEHRRSLQPGVVLQLDVGVSLLLENVATEQFDDTLVASLEPAIAMLLEALSRAGLSQRSENADTGQVDRQRTHKENLE